MVQCVHTPVPLWALTTVSPSTTHSMNTFQAFYNRFHIPVSPISFAVGDVKVQVVGEHWEWEGQQQGHALVERVSALDMGWCLCLCVEQASEVLHLMGDTCQERQCALGAYTLPHFELVVSVETVRP